MSKDKLDILYEDKYLIIINKKSNLLTISTDYEKENTLYKKVSSYVKRQHKSNKIYIVHRLDKDTSGIIIFAKTKEIKEKLQSDWKNTVRKYIALVEKEVKEDGVIKSWLKETKTLYTYSSYNKNDGLFAMTKYKVLKHNRKYSLLEIEIFTGRKNQIRVHMKDINHPIVGDKKYNSSVNPFKRLCLHAYYLRFTHPVSKQILEIKTEFPEFAKKVV